MGSRFDERLTRRRLLEISVALGGSLAAAACDASGRSDRAATTEAAKTPTALPPTPACDDEDATPEQSEGPFFTPDSPERASLLEPGIEGTRLVVAGSVLTTDCRPVAGALLDFWHADGGGRYDNEGYRMRGHQFAGRDGGYRLETIVPGLYAGRTRHIHVKVQAPRGPVLTTQLYFPGEPDNARDAIFDPALVMAVDSAASGRAARFEFVLAEA